MPGTWRKCCTFFRWLRYSLWVLIVLALLALGWTNVVGFPEVLKKRLTHSLEERGMTLQFSRLRWRFIHGLVAENVIIGDRQVRGEKPVFTAGQIQLRLNYWELLRKKFQLTGIVVRDGIFTLPISPTNRLTWLNLQAEVSFLPQNTWSLDALQADFSGAKIRLAGQVAHAPEAKNWELFAGKKKGGQDTLAQPLRNFSATLAKIKFTRPPQISATFNGDAREVHSFTVRVNADVPDVTTPWFAGRRLQFAADLTTPPPAVSAEMIQGFWTNAVPFRLKWTTRAGSLDVASLEAGAVECNGLWSAPQLSVNKLSCHLGGGEIQATAALDLAARELAFTNASAFDPHILKELLPENARVWLADILWTRPPALTVAGKFALPPWTNGAPDWKELMGGTTQFHGELACTNAVLRGQTVELARMHFNYANLIWSVPDLKFIQGRTQLEFSGGESLATENFRAAFRGNLDTASVRPFMPTNLAGPLFRLVKVGQPVVLNLEAAGNLRNFGSLVATGRVAVADFTVREQAYESAAGDFYYTNRVLSFLHPQSLRANGTQVMTADAVVLDWNARMYYFSNGFSTTDPMAVVRAIGPKTARIIEPYEFLSPPTAHVNGRLPLRDLNSGRDLAGTDIRFDIIRGAPFRWTKLSTTNIIGTIHWMGQELALTNIVASVYGGSGEGHAYFDFRPAGYGCDFNFGLSVMNVDARLLAEALSTNRTHLIEGRLTALAEVTQANSLTWQSWNGYGAAQLHEGQLWDIPIFGFASHVLDNVTPGLGHSRATDATVNFTLTNGVARSDLLEIHTLTMRLQYSGTVDLKENINARVTAQLLRNTPVIGSVISLVLSPVSKIFECQISGQISDPKVTPLYFPFSKYLLKPLHPIRTFEEMLPPADRPRG